MLPMLIISVLSTKLPSQFFEVTYDICFVLVISCMNLFNSKSNTFKLVLVSGNILLKGIKKVIIVNIANGILLLVSLISSDTLILINISIKRNKIDTAPTYTNK